MPNITDGDKLKICKTCALIVSRKRPRSRLEIHELENIGFIHIESNIPRKAYSEAYYNMLQKASLPRFDKNKPAAQQRFLNTRTAMGRRQSCTDEDVYAYDADTLIDVKNAIMDLPVEDIHIAVMYLLVGCTQKDLCDVLHLSQPTVSIKLQGICDRLCHSLSSYEEVF